MDISIHFDLVQMLGIGVIAYLAGMVGSVAGIIFTGFHTPSLDGQKFFTIAGMVQALIPLQIPKLIVAAVGAGAAMYFFPEHAIRSAALITFGLGAFVMVVVGFLAKRG